MGKGNNRRSRSARGGGEGGDRVSAGPSNGDQTRSLGNPAVLESSEVTAAAATRSSAQGSANRATAPAYDRPQEDRVVEGVRRGASEMVKKNSAWSRDSNTSGSSSKSKMGTEEQVSDQHARNGNATTTTSPKKQKQMDSGTYPKYYKRARATGDTVVATPDRVGKDTPSGYVPDINIAMPCEGAIIVESHSSGAVYKGLKSPISGLHETSETRVGQHTSPFSERKIMLGDGGPISSQKEDSDSRQLKVTPSDETDGNSDICVACGTPVTIDYRSCDGKGCNNRYHISCLDPSLEYLSLGIWFCTSCTQKRFDFGLHSIIDGIESLWDVKEAKGIHNGKQYFVKYKNLAHVHNRWVPESVINDTPGGPNLLSLFNKRTHTEKTFWRHEWTMPYRLLRKRPLMPPELADDFVCSLGPNVAYCNVEWLVKWRGLGYDCATWELENSPFLCTREADELKKNYENRHEAAKKASVCKKTEQVKQTSFQKLERLPDMCHHPDFDNDHLFAVNQLREFWYKSHGAIVVDDQEHVMKTILFTASVLSEVCQPFLIVTTPASLSLWEAQFNNLASFINVVVYDGGKDKLKIIQDLEFYENGSCVMLQVLLSHPGAILEDIESIACIDWEAVIVDYYQNSALKYLEKLKKLPTDFRALLLSSPVQDNLHEYTKLLSFLNSGEQENNNDFGTADALVMSKIRFRRHIAYQRQADSSKNLEHWVPAYLSQLQLQNYCSILLSDSSVLRSQIKTDSAGVMCDIIMSLSKCCDHPYLIDRFLQNSRANNHDRTESIDTSVHACGKLVLLDKMLKETRNKRLRVIILFQSDRSTGNKLGDILEGVVCQRFGPESYERAEFGAVRSRKQAAVNMFNDKTKGRFVFLIDNHACLPSIELSSVDAIIIYNSNWNPLNDLKALRRMKIESRFKYPSIFRLYSPFTIEEKKLMLAKQGMHITQESVGSLSHSLISWGASFLFTRLDELQQDNYASKSSKRDSHFTDNVISEFLTNLAASFEDNTKINSGFISKASMSGEFYSRSITLIGEKEGMPALDRDPSNFWSSLLDGRSPCWSYISEPPQSSSRMLQNMEEAAKNPTKEGHEDRSKGEKVGEITCPSSKSCDDTLPGNCTTSSSALQPLDDVQSNLGVKRLMGTPKSHDNQPNEKVSKLVKVLEKRIDLIDTIFSLREKSILDKQQLEISELEAYIQNKVIRLKEVCNLVLEHIRRSHVGEVTKNEKTKVIIQWFTMLMFAFLQHISLQHNKLRALQFDIWSKEQKLKENLHQEAKSGQLDDIFDQYIALPASNFVIEDFIHESCIVKSSISDCQHPSSERLLNEITMIHNVVPISTQPMQNESVEIPVDLGRTPASEALDILENNIHRGSDGISLQNVGTEAVGNLQPQVPASTSMQNHAEQPGLMHVEPTEAEGHPSVLDTTAAHSEERGGPEQPTQLLPPDASLFDHHHPVSSTEPLKNELEMIKHAEISVSKAHEQKRSMLLMEYNQEMERIKSKYNSLVQKEDSAYLERKAMLTAGVDKKVVVHQSQAKKFREMFNGYHIDQVGSTSAIMEQPPVLNPFPLPGTSSPSDLQIQSILHGNLYRPTSPPFNPVVVTRGSYRYAGLQRSHGVQPRTMLSPRPRGSYGRSLGTQQPRVPPTPRLHQLLRTQSPYAIQTNQQTMASASSSRPSSSMPRLEFLGDFAQPSSPNHILMTSGQSTQSMVFPGSTSSPLNATQMAGVDRSGYESTSSDTRQPVNDSEVAAPQVIVLSDDE